MQPHTTHKALTDGQVVRVLLEAGDLGVDQEDAAHDVRALLLVLAARLERHQRVLKSSSVQEGVVQFGE